jgi:hypothetical protein
VIMTNKKESPDGLAADRSSNNLYPLCDDHKDTPKLSKRQRKVCDLLMTGRFSVADITIRLGYCDPRGYIAILRRKGLIINDMWVKTDNIRYKRYWIEKTEL